MLKDFWNTLEKVNHLRSIIGYNGLVFALKNTPVIGKIIPNSLYGSTLLKVIYWVFHIIKEAFTLFIGKIAGLSAIYLLSFAIASGYKEDGLAAGLSQANLFGDLALLLFMLYALCGLAINMTIFRCTTEKEYLVFMLRMNAKKLNLTLFIYDLGKLFIGYLITGIFAALFGAPIWVWLGIPFLSVAIKLWGAGYLADSYRRKHAKNKPMRQSKWGPVLLFTAIMLSMPFLVIILFAGYFIPLPVLLGVAGLFMLLGVWGFFALREFDSAHHRRALRDNIVRNEIERKKNPDMSKQFKSITATGSVNTGKKGFEFLNALFVRRHMKILLVKPIICAVVFAAFAALVIYRFLIVMRNDSVSDFLMYLASYHLLAMLIPLSIADVSYKGTQAMYINCDSSLMTFSFFKQRDKIMKLFDIRLIQFIKINAIPAVVLGLATDAVIFFAGGQAFPAQYLLTPVITILIQAVYTTSWLALYYLFQPFTTTANVKGGAYLATRFILSAFAFFVCWIPLNPLILSGVLAAFTALYIFIVRKLVYKISPKTWKIRA